MPRLNPRLRMRKQTHNANEAFMAGLTVSDFKFFMELAAQHGTTEYDSLLKRLQAGGDENAIITENRNGTVTVTIKTKRNTHDIQGLWHLRVIASLALHDLIDQVPDKDEQLSFHSHRGARGRRDHPYARMSTIINMLDIDSDAERMARFNYHLMNLRDLDSLGLQRRAERIRRNIKFRKDMDAMFAKFQAKRDSGEEVTANEQMSAMIDIVLDKTA